MTHHAEANMPTVNATSGVCKFHTCPIILRPSLPPFLPPFLPPSCVPPLFTTHAHPPRSLTPHTEQLEKWKAALGTCNREQGAAAGTDEGSNNTEGLFSSVSLPTAWVYSQERRSSPHDKGCSCLFFSRNGKKNDIMAAELRVSLKPELSTMGPFVKKLADMDKNAAQKMNWCQFSC
ncbi:unnamed protein product [Pleuronectes platessa]|uniref:Uncharacterized protein n=1 Tax=Pleuronectes platessa TaxID=8262 RepID=A0A9N7TSN8_PLEPL|nr:unnamed protein product [Pleuronectes platessa]